MELAFLAPDIQRATMKGQQPQGLTLHQLLQLDLPKAWDEQRWMLDFQPA